MQKANDQYFVKKVELQNELQYAQNHEDRLKQGLERENEMLSKVRMMELEIRDLDKTLGTKNDHHGQIYQFRNEIETIHYEIQELKKFRIQQMEDKQLLKRTLGQSYIVGHDNMIAHQ